MAAVCWRPRWHFICIILSCLRRQSLYNAEASHARSEEGEERHRKSRRLTLKGKDLESPSSNEVETEDVMITKAAAKRNQAERKRIKKMVRQQKKRARIELKRASLLKTQYDSTQDVVKSSSSPPMPMEPPPPPPLEYGPPDMMIPPPPPPIIEGGDEYRPPPPLMMGPHLPDLHWQPDGWSNNNNNHNHQQYERSSSNNNNQQYGWNGRGSKASKALRPIEPPPHIPPPHHRPFPPHPYPPPGKPTFFPTYLTSYPTNEQPDSEYTRETVRISIPSLMNSYGIAFPTSREEYDALVRTLQQTIYQTAKAPLNNNQKVTEVKIIEIEGITPQEPNFHRQLQSVNENNNIQGTGSLQCTFEERQECCSKDPPPGKGNPVQYCQSLGCDFNTCRRIRFDIVAEQLLVEQGRNRKLQSITDDSIQSIVDNLYNSITSFMTEQVKSGEFTMRLRGNAHYCGDVCLSTLADASVTNVDFAPATDILIAIPTPAPTKFPTRQPIPPPTSEPTYQPTTEEPTVEPTTYPTISPTLFPTRVPTEYPTSNPTYGFPTLFPTASPTESPMAPTLFPTLSPTLEPTQEPTLDPTPTPTELPTRSPSLVPTISPTSSPTDFPTISPTESPTLEPTISPTESPTVYPTVSPTISPTLSPTISPTISPTTTVPPTPSPPTRAPTKSPTSSPTKVPTKSPTSSPTPIQPT